MRALIKHIIKGLGKSEKVTREWSSGSVEIYGCCAGFLPAIALVILFVAAMCGAISFWWSLVPVAWAYAGLVRLDAIVAYFDGICKEVDEEEE